jgi:hypothetical protein
MGKQLSGWQAFFLVIATLGVGFAVIAFTPLIPLLALLWAPLLLLGTSAGVYFAIRHFFADSKGMPERCAAVLASIFALLQLLGFGAGLWEGWLKSWQRVINFY